MREFVIVTPLIGLLLVISGLTFGQQSIEEAIKNRVKQYETASNAGSTDSMAVIYAVNGTHTFANGVTLRGRVEIANGLKEQYAGMFKGTHMSITPLHIRALSPDIAVEEASFVVSGIKDANGKKLPSINGFCLIVYQRDGDQWYIEAAQCMVPPPQNQGQ